MYVKQISFHYIKGALKLFSARKTYWTKMFIIREMLTKNLIILNFSLISKVKTNRLEEPSSIEGKIY